MAVLKEAAGDDRGVQLASLVVKNEALVFVAQSSHFAGNQECCP